MWILKCPSCEAECMEDGPHVCTSCRKEMKRWRKVDDDYLKDMSNRNYWVQRKNLEQDKASGKIDQKEYDRRRKLIEKYLHKHKTGPQLFVAVDKPLIVPKSDLKKF